MDNKDLDAKEDGRLSAAGAAATASPVLRTEPQSSLGLGPDGRVPHGAGHTPGPWEIVTTPNANLPGAHWREILYRERGLIVAEVYHDLADDVPGLTDEEAAANARMIAAAPTMFEALEKCRDFLMTAPLESGVCCCGDPIEGHNIGSGHSPVDMLHYAASNQVELIDAALSLARGESRARAAETKP